MTLLTLEELDVSSNVIYVLNDDISNLVNLRKLILNSNKLAALPKSIKCVRRVLAVRGRHARFTC